MPASSIPSGSQRLLSLLSLLQIRRGWSGEQLAERLEVSPRTVRRDVDRLRELGYPIHTTKGPDGGYRLDAGSQMPPLLFDDDQTVALAIALRGASLTGAGIDEAATRALATLRQVMPARLRTQLDALDMVVVPPPTDEAPPPETQTLLAISAAIQNHEELRFDYLSPKVDTDSTSAGQPNRRRVHPHHLIAKGGRWYVVAWVPERENWRIYRVDRMTPRVPTGPRFTPRDVPGGDPASYLEARFKGSDSINTWPCHAEVILDRPAHEIIPYVRDGVVEALDSNRSRVRLGAWSWAGLAATLARWDADIEVVSPAELRAAFADLADRATRAAGDVVLPRFLNNDLPPT
ncbi:Bifunctional ligase/repressor BirA [Mycolicibacterium vanbaalenii]|uniref:Bifunctional ligase/repressor BirA n=1 Tax=Mycolicibacterium vanbaalenii TaxID=110539 RepID=A0A5S9QMB4_MYCVN|nr:WYL domain-containing protein [Mycolicibacterium vanbaalenii]CAA0120127.1 Bifunctional ligase/repressor BirA [Mycolicibacterium vanbaalenii]